MKIKGNLNKIDRESANINNIKNRNHGTTRNTTKYSARFVFVRVISWLSSSVPALRILPSITILTALVSVMALAQPPAKTAPPKKTNGRPAAPKAPKEPFDSADVKTMAAQCVRLDTEAGIIELEMYPESAPESVRNFLNLAATGALDNTTFSRVVPGFVIQGGDLYTNEKITRAQKWRAVRKLPDEPGMILHERGILSMARSSEPDSATTHFFILLKSAPSLNSTFAAFGRVTKGMEVVDAINKMPGMDEKPEKPVRIRKATVFTCPAAASPVPAPTPTPAN
jgi:cyclophilin family peptidyl-prolyl cis-trans isomerase